MRMPMAKAIREPDEYIDGYYHHPHRSRHSTRRHTRSEETLNVPGSFPTFEEPNVGHHRRPRARYYTVSRRREISAAGESGERSVRSRQRKASSSRESRRLRVDDVEQGRSSDEDSDAYVYGRHRDASARHARSYEEMASGQTSKSPAKRWSARPHDEGVKLSRSSSTRRHAVASRTPLSPRRAAEEDSNEQDDRDGHQRIPGSFEPTPEVTKIGRSISLRDPTRAYMTRPAIRRSLTISRPRAVSAQPVARRPARAASISGKQASSPVNSKETRRNTGGLLSGFFVPPKTPVKPEKRKFECVICMSDDIPASRSAKLSCGHRMCSSCLKRQFELSVTDPQHMPPKCCTSEHIPLKYVERLFDHKFKVLWNKKYQEYTTKNRTYCPTRGCGEWIKPSNVRTDMATGRKYGKCGRCRMKVCILCNGKWHTRKECPKDEETKRLVEIAKQKGWQRCYNCKAMVELKEGCNHMTCRCTAQFCMICGLQWKTCNCPWFNYTDPNASDHINMMIPEALRVIIEDEPDQAAPGGWPAPPPSPPQQIVLAGDGSRRLRRRQSADRRAQERVDESLALARRLQNQLTLSTPSHTGGSEINVEVFGVGNSGMHHMNESYVVRPVVRATGPTPRTRRARVFRSRESVRAAERPPPRASAMAGLSQDGSRRGAARVGKWLQHVEHDPAEVEGRAQELDLDLEYY